MSYKNYNLKNNECAGLIKGYNNLSYVVDSSTEFQNLNNLKNTDYKFKKSYLNFKSGSETDTVAANTSIENINEMPSQHVDANIFEDKYDIEKKLQKNNSLNSDKLVSSINEELNRMKSVYKK